MQSRVQIYVEVQMCWYAHFLFFLFSFTTPLWGAADAEIKVPSGENTESLNFLPLKPRLGSYIAIHATLTARNFFLAYFNPSSPFTSIFFQNVANFSCVVCG